MHRYVQSAQAWLFGLIVCIGIAGCAATSQSGVRSDGIPEARNVILFIGDGMGLSTITAARIFADQALGKSGEEQQLIFETFPNVALVETYNTNQQVPDSAGSATAMMTGQETRAA